MADSKLRVYREEREVCIQIKLSVTGSTFTWRWNAGTEWAATLLVNAINDEIGERMKEERGEAYADGWRHAKAKTKRGTWFTGRLP